MISRGQSAPNHALQIMANARWLHVLTSCRRTRMMPDVDSNLSVGNDFGHQAVERSVNPFHPSVAIWSIAGCPQLIHLQLYTQRSKNIILKFRAQIRS